LAADQACPCGRTDTKGRAVPYAACCGRYLDGDTPAPDAEHLMRSRYTAFVRQRADYLLATWHPSHRPRRSTSTRRQWLGLEVRSHRVTDADTPRSNSSPATAWAAAPCACTNAAASCASRRALAWRAGCTLTASHLLHFS
jgi:uncharacterized protein YchJ